MSWLPLAGQVIEPPMHSPAAEVSHVVIRKRARPMIASLTLLSTLVIVQRTALILVRPVRSVPAGQMPGHVAGTALTPQELYPVAPVPHCIDPDVSIKNRKCGLTVTSACARATRGASASAAPSAVSVTYRRSAAG